VLSQSAQIGQPAQEDRPYTLPQDRLDIWMTHDWNEPCDPDEQLARIRRIIAEPGGRKA
jgi:hypothetical protein